MFDLFTLYVERKPPVESFLYPGGPRAKAHTPEFGFPGQCVTAFPVETPDGLMGFVGRTECGLDLFAFLMRERYRGLHREVDPVYGLRVFGGVFHGVGEFRCDRSVGHPVRRFDFQSSSADVRELYAEVRECLAPVCAWPAELSEYLQEEDNG